MSLWSPSQSLPRFTFQSTKSIDGTLSYNTETFRNHQLQRIQHHLNLHSALAWKRFNGSIKRSHKLQPCSPIRNILPPYFHLCKSPKSRQDFTCTWCESWGEETSHLPSNTTSYSGHYTNTASIYVMHRHFFSIPCSMLTEHLLSTYDN